MTKREQYLKAYRNQPFERLTWAPNFDYWLHVNTRLGRVPAEYVGMARNGIVRAVGGTIWARVCTVGLSTPDLRTERIELGEGSWRTVTHTSKGELTALYVTLGGEDHSVFLREHPVKTADDLPALLECIRATRLSVDAAQSRRELEAAGDDGIVVDCNTSVPFIQFGKVDAGWEQGLYLWHDHREQVEEILHAYLELDVQIAALTCENSAADVFHSNDNMDQLMVSPELFTRYALPYYRRIADIVHRHGKVFSVHWCGRTDKLLPLLRGSGVDVVEAVVTRPMTDLTVEQALASLGGEVVMQGGVPAVLMCREGGSRQDLERCVCRIAREIRPRRSFVLGMGDNVPPNADFDRVRLIGDIVRDCD